MIKTDVIKRLSTIDKIVMQSNKPHLVFIDLEQTGWRITEHYFNGKYQVSFKTYHYDNYEDYLNKADLNDNTPVIINDLPRYDERGGELWV